MKKKVNLFITILSCLIYVLVMFIFDINLGTGKKELENILIIISPCLMFLFYLLYYEKDKKIIWYYLMLYITMLIGFTFSNNRVNYLTINNILKRENNLVPFVSMINLFKYSKRTFLYNALGNLLMLTPLAVLLPLLSDKFKRVKNYFLCVLILTIIIESAQYIFKLGSFDIDDIILNTSGAILFYLFINLKVIDKLLRNIFFLEKNKINGKDLVKPILALFIFIVIIISIIFIFIKKSNDSNQKWNEIYNPLIEFSYDKTCSENNMFYEDELFEYYFNCYDKDKFYLIVNKKDKLLIKDFLDSSKYVYDIEKLTWKLKQNNIEYYTKHKNPNYILHLPKFDGDFGYKGVKNDYVNIVVKGLNTSIYDLDLNFIPLKEGKTTIDFKVTNEGKVYTYTFDITIDKDLNLKYELKN